MRVYVPDKKEHVINEVLQELYMLKKAIDYGAGTPDSRIGMIDRVRDKLKTLLESQEWKEL
jgi:hypothetical protein